MIPAEVNTWLAENASQILNGYSEAEEALPEGWEMTLAEHFGGEGEGDTYYSVWSFKQKDTQVLVRVNGWYQSYNGAEYQDFEEVMPVQKTITVYEAVK